MTPNLLNRFSRAAGAAAAWIVAWQIISMLVPGGHSILPGPAQVARALTRVAAQPANLHAVVETFVWVTLAWVVGVLIAVTLSALCSWIPIQIFISPPSIVGRTLPSVVVIPLVAGVAGISRLSTFSAATFIVVSYALPLTISSYRELQETWSSLTVGLQMSQRQALLLVQLPGMGQMVSIVAAQTLGLALVVTLAGEMLLAQGGIGQAISDLTWVLRMSEAYGFVVILVLFSMLGLALVRALATLAVAPGRRMVRRVCVRRAH